MLDKLAGIILQFIVISRKLLLEIGVVIKPACKPILMVAAFLPAKSPGVLNDFLESTVSDPDNHTYKHYVPSLVSVLWNSTIKEHAIERNGCDGGDSRLKNSTFQPHKRFGTRILFIF
jgi:hypothetical protein